MKPSRHSGNTKVQIYFGTKMGITAIASYETRSLVAFLEVAVALAEIVLKATRYTLLSP